MGDPLLWTWDWIPGANAVRMVVFLVASILVGLTVRVTITAWRAGEPYRTWSAVSYGLLMTAVALTVLIGYGRPLYIVPTAVFAAAVFTGVMGARVVFKVAPEWKRLRETEAARHKRHKHEDAVRAEDRAMQDDDREERRRHD